MSYENQLIREATGQTRDFEEQEPEEPNESTETDDQQGETLKLSGNLSWENRNEEQQ